MAPLHVGAYGHDAPRVLVDELLGRVGAELRLDVAVVLRLVAPELLALRLVGVLLWYSSSSPNMWPASCAAVFWVTSRVPPSPRSEIWMSDAAVLLLVGGVLLPRTQRLALRPPAHSVLSLSSTACARSLPSLVLWVLLPLDVVRPTENS